MRAARFKELELQFLCAEQDGVEPAVLISAGGSKGPQVIFATRLFFSTAHLTLATLAVRAVLIFFRHAVPCERS